MPASGQSFDFELATNQKNEKQKIVFSAEAEYVL